MKKVVITSGFFNPVHSGHINLIEEAKKLGDFLIVIVNSDDQVRVKGSVPFMDEKERMRIIKALRYTDDVMLAIDKDGFVPKSLAALAQKYSGNELIFAKGGDRNLDNLPESEKQVCKEFNITVIGNVGGGKVQSSSVLLSKIKAN